MSTSLNPFMNQVSFYAATALAEDLGSLCLNPFMNQVSFYGQHVVGVLPLRLAS